MRSRRLKVFGNDGTYHVMSRTVNGERLFGDREKEVLRKMIWQVADFSGVEVLTYCIMSNHFHVLVRVPVQGDVSDQELLRRYKTLYPKPTKFQTGAISIIEKALAAGGENAEAIRLKLLARMGDVSDFMKTLKQRFSIWYNRSHHRFGTLWAERFKSVLVEGRGNALQTMAVYIDLNPVRAGIVQDPKDYRFCGYAEAVAGLAPASRGLWRIWADRLAATHSPEEAARSLHREFMFGARASDEIVTVSERERLLQALEDATVKLPRASVLRCRVRYFTDGAILGSEAYVRGFIDLWQMQRSRKYPPKINPMQGAEWGGLATIQALRQRVFA